MAIGIDENQLISQLQVGDRKAINNFIDTYGKFMYNVIYRILCSVPETEEATQDAVMKVINNLGSYDNQASLKAWCYTIAYRTGIDYQRKTKYHQELIKAENMMSTQNIEDILIVADQKRQIEILMSILDETSKTIITLYYLEEKNIKEIIACTGLSESNIKIKLYRARKQMADCYKIQKTL